MRAEIKSIREQRPRTRLTSRFPQFAQSPLASASRSHTDRRFSYHVSPEADDDLLAVRPAIFTPEWTMSPQVCTRVPFLGCSSKLTHCASTTPSAWSIHPTLCPGWQFVITRLPSPASVLQSPAGFPLPTAFLRASSCLHRRLQIHSIAANSRKLPRSASGWPWWSHPHTPVFGYLERSREGHSGFIIYT